MVYQHKLGKISKAKQRLLITLTVLALIAQPLFTMVMTPQSAFAISTSEALITALADSGQPTINLSGDITVSESLVINRPVTIIGNGKTISSNFAGTDNDNNATISVRSTSGVTLSNLIVDGSGGSNIHGINIWRGTDINLEGITVQNHTDGKYGVVVGASSTANINNITTAGNSFGINIDVGDDDTSETPPTLNVTGVSEHNELFHMAKESGTVNDINGQYDHYEIGTLTGYILKTVHLSPADGVVLRAGDEVKPTWKPVNSDAVAGYEYRVAKNGSVDSEGKLNVEAFEWPLFIYNGNQNTQHNGTGTADGTYFWQVRNLYKIGALEVKGAWTTPWSATVDTTTPTDTTPPTTPRITAPGARQYLRGASTINSWTASTDDQSGVAEYQVRYEFVGRPTALRTVPASQTSRTQTFTGSYQGPITISVRARDNAGNWSPYSASVTYNYDSINPVTDINVSPVVDNSFTVTGNASDNLALNRVAVQLVNRQDSQRYGLTTVNLIPNGNTAAWSVTYNTNDLPDGDYAAHVSVVDRAGNSSTAGWTEDFAVAKTSPTPPEGLDEPNVIVPTSPTSTTTRTTAPQPQQGSPSTPTSPSIAPAFGAFATLFNPDGTVGATAIPEGDDDIEDVLGAESDDQSSILGAENTLAQGASNLESEGAWKAFGVTWYWWLAAFGMFATTWWLVAAARRRQQEERV